MSVSIRFGQVLEEEELRNRMSELSPEQFQMIIQVVQTNVEEIGSIIDGPKVDPMELKHLSGGLYWSRTILEKLIRLREDPPPPSSFESESEILP